MPSAVRPIGKTNAIAEMAFVLRLARPLNAEEMQRLEPVAASLQAELPFAGKLAGFTVMMPPTGGAEVLTQPPGGLFLQRLGADQRPVWMLRVDEHSIIVNCMEYTRWAEIWPQARHFMGTVLATVEADSIGLRSGSLQVIDRFVYDDPPAIVQYAVSDVFRDDCPFLTAQARASGHYWHVHQGWFEPFNIEVMSGRLLNVLNLSSGDLPDQKLVTTIDHLAQADLAEVAAGWAVSEPGLDEMFNRLHERNRLLLQSTVNSRMLEAIGMAP